MSDGELRKLFRKHLHGFDFQAIETGSTSGGVPDLNGCKNRTEFWVECKACEHWRVVIRPAQIGWAERRLRHGGRVFCAVRRKQEELWLFDGWQLRTLLTARIDIVPCLGHWQGGPACWDWARVEHILLADPPQ